MKDVYQNQSVKEKVIVVIAKNKEKKSNKQADEKSKPIKEFKKKSEEIDQNLTTEIQHKLKSKRVIDKPSSKFLHGGKRRNRHKVLFSILII